MGGVASARDHLPKYAKAMVARKKKNVSTRIVTNAYQRKHSSGVQQKYKGVEQKRGGKRGSWKENKAPVKPS